MERFYAGIGARKTPPDVLRKMRIAASAMAALGFTLRSGGAEGADSAFEAGCDDRRGKKEIFLPFKGFRKNESPLFGTIREARLLAKEFHPNWSNLGNLGRDFMGRNAYQVLGLNLKTPSTFILCWTPKGAITGGTGQALRMAKHFKILVLNFATQTDNDISDFIYAQEATHK